MRIAIMGAGTVGSSLGRALVRAGHEVMFSSRQPDSDKMRALLAEMGDGAQAGSVEVTLNFSEVVALAMPWDTIKAVVQVGDWSSKIVIDMSNRFGPPPADSTGTVAGDIARMTGARVVKAFNSIGANRYEQPQINGQAASMLVAGDAADAKAVVMGLAEDIGFEPVDAGDLSAARHVENLAALWVHLARSGYGRDIGFKLLRE